MAGYPYEPTHIDHSQTVLGIITHLDKETYLYEGSL